MDFKYHVDDFSLKSTLECGQCFRWKKLSDGSFFGIVGNHSLRVEQKESTVIFYDTTEEEFQQLWRSYFDFDTVISLAILMFSSDGKSPLRSIKYEPSSHIKIEPSSFTIRDAS